MRKLLILSVFALLAFASCKKTHTNVSQLHTYSTPTITIKDGQLYYSIPVGGTLPHIDASARDSFYDENDPILIDQSTLDNTTPGLYVVTASAKNQYGMASSVSVYVAVTDIAATINISGQYKRTSNGVVVNVTKLANGLYMSDNIGGVDSVTSPSSVTAVLPGLFVQTSTTEIILPSQPSSQGTLAGSNGTINMLVPITYSFIITSPATVFAQSTRTFVKQ